MDTPITKRLIISGLTTSISADDISRRLTTFGTVKALDGFGLVDGLGQPRKFGYVTLETTTGKLAKCMNLLSGSTWKGAKLRFGEAKPDFKERIALENKAAAERPPKKRRNEGSQAEDMTLVTSANASDREGWDVSSLGRITRPVKMRPEKPLPEIQHEESINEQVPVGTTEREKKKNKRFKDPDSRARRRTIDMTKWGSTHLKGMFLDMPALGTKRLKLDDVYDPMIESEGNEESGDDNNTLKVPGSSKQNVFSQMPLSPSVPPLPTNSGTISPNPILPASSMKPQPSVGKALPLPDNNTDLEVEKTQSLNLLSSLFGDGNWVRPESVASDVDIDDLKKGDAMLVDDDEDGIEIVPIDNPDGGITRIKGPQNEEQENQREIKEKESPLGRVTSTKLSELNKTRTSTKLKDLFAPREEEAGFSLLGHLDLDLELDNDVPFFAEQPISTQGQTSTYTHLPPTVHPSHSSWTPIVLNPKQALFFPHPQQQQGILNKVRQKDIFDLIKDNHWNWRDSSVGFYRTGTEEDIRKRWEEGKSELTKEWKKRWREAGKANRRRRGGVDANAEV